MLGWSARGCSHSAWHRQGRQPTSDSFFPLGLHGLVSHTKHTGPAQVSGCGGMHAGKCFGSRKHSAATAAPWHSAPPPCPPANGEVPLEPRTSCQWGGPAGSPHSPTTPLPRDLNPVAISSLLANPCGGCKQSPRDGAGGPGQDTEWLAATLCLAPSAGIEASALLVPKPVNRDQCPEGPGQEWGGFCVLM